MDEKTKLARARDSGQNRSSVELPGIEPAALPGNMPFELRFRYVAFRFSPARYLRFRSRVLTASRRVAYRRELPASYAPRRNATRVGELLGHLLGR